LTGSKKILLEIRGHRLGVRIVSEALTYTPVLIYPKLSVSNLMAS